MTPELYYALLATWLGVALAIAVFMPRTKGNLAYRLTDDPVFYWVGRFFTALHWPLLLLIVPVILVFDKRARTGGE